MPEHAVPLTSLITDRPLCVSCISRKSTLNPAAVETALSVMERAVPVHRRWGACPECGASGTVFVHDPSAKAEP